MAQNEEWRPGVADSEVNAGAAGGMRPSSRIWVLSGCLVLVVLILVRPRERQMDTDPGGGVGRVTAGVGELAGGGSVEAGGLGQKGRSAEEVVAAKVVEFGRQREEFAEAIARRRGLTLPAEVERFFEAVRGGRWEEIRSAYEVLVEMRAKLEHPAVEALHAVWPAILEAFGAAEVAHEWPARRLLDYGQSILSALPPGAIYLGGTDAGRFIPALLNDTSPGERHVVLTQNSLADQSYLEYVREMHGERLAALTSEDSKRAFEEYIAGAGRRLAHDREFPDEPPQLRPGEDVQMEGNRVMVGGQVAVMAINEILVQAMMAKNPGVVFAVEESYPFKSTYAQAVPSGPILEVQSGGGAPALTGERASAAVDYWRRTAGQLMADMDGGSSETVLSAYAKLAASQANLLAHHQYGAQAEQAYRVALQLMPGQPDATFGLARILEQTGRAGEAARMLEGLQRQQAARGGP